MASRRPLLLLVPLLLLGLMVAALLLALDGESPTALLPGDDGPVAVEGADGGATSTPGDERGGEYGRRSRRQARITGSVRDLRTREPASGRLVTLNLADGGVRQATTSGSGEFVFSDVPPGAAHELRVDGDDHAPVARPGLYLSPGERRDLGTLWLADGVRVLVEIRAFDGRPLSGATVRAFAQGPGTPAFDAPRDPPPVALVHSGQDGIAAFEGLPPGTWTFTAERGGYARRGLVDAVVREGVDEERFELALENGHRLTGHVRDAVGRPVAGAPVLAIRRTLVSDRTTAPLALRTTTDRDGAYTLGSLPAADVVIWSGWPGGRLAVLAAVRVPGVRTLDLVLQRGGRLEGRVTREADGQPIPDAKVAVNLQVLGSFVLAFEVETDHEGRYALDLPMPGAITGVSASARGYRAESAEVEGEVQAPTGSLVRFDVPLRRGGIITGTVTGPDGPLAGVEVGATNPGWYVSAFTDRTGHYEIGGLPAERFFVVANLWGHDQPDRPQNPDGALQDGSAPARFVADLTATSEIRIDIPMTNGPMLRGRVLTHDGAPAAGAVVAIPWGAAATHTAADGSFEVGPVAREAIELLATAADGGGRGHVSVQVPAAPAEPEPVTITLGPSMRVSGHVTSATGAALRGAYVQVVPWSGELEHPVQDEWSWLEATRLPVAADGSFDHVVDGSAGTFVVRAAALGHRRARTGALSVSADRPEVIVDLTLEAGASFTGRVVNLDGVPVPGAYVASVPVPLGTDPYGVGYPGAWGPPITAVADEDGVFRIDGLEEGPHALRAWAEGHLPDAQVVNVPEDSGATFEIVAALTISGVVTYDDGEPVVGARVVAMADDGSGYAEGRTDADGRFEVPGLSSGSYRVEVAPSADGRQNLIPDAIQGVAAGTPDARVTVQRGRVIAGHVLDADGAPVAGAGVAAMRGDDTYSETATDAEGAFRVTSLAAGRYTVSVEAQALQSIGRVVREADAGDEDVVVRLPAPGVMSGVVVGPDGGAIANRQLQLRPRDSGGDVDAWPVSVSTAADGSFSVPAAPGVTYTAVLTEHENLTLPRGMSITAGETGVRLVAIAGSAIRGRVVDGDGKPAPGVEVRASGENVQRRTMSGDDGSFTIEGLFDGVQYQLWVAGSNWQLMNPEPTEAPASGVVLRVQQLLHAGGKVLSADGAPLGGVTVTVVGDGGSAWSTYTQDDGTFYVSGLPAGTYTVRVVPDDDGDAVDCGTIRAGVIGTTLRVPAR